MENNRINPSDDVRVEIYEGAHKVDTIVRSGLHNVDQAVEAAYEGSNATITPSKTMYGVSPTSQQAPPPAIVSTPAAISASSQKNAPDTRTPPHDISPRTDNCAQSPERRKPDFSYASRFHHPAGR